jgi:hypothetical protein
MVRHLRQLAVPIVAVVTGVVLFGSVASASINIPENPIPVSSGQDTVTVSISYSVTAGHALFFDQCKKIATDPTFNFASDCSTLTQYQLNPADNTGSGTLDFSVFRGDEPAGGPWGCYAPGDTPKAGRTNFSTCYLRVTLDTPANNGQAQDVAFTFTTQGAPVPESPLTIALPFVAAAVIGAAYLWRRRRINATPLPG